MKTPLLYEPLHPYSPFPPLQSHQFTNHHTFSFFLFALTFLAYSIKDLEGQDSTTFNQEVSQWTYNGGTPASSSETQLFSSVYLFGRSYSSITSFERTYASLPSHNFITFTLTLYAGGWFGGAIAVFNFDSSSITSPRFLWWSEGNPSTNPLYYKGAVSHTGSSLNLRISVLLDANGMVDTWFGFRDLSIFLHKDHSGTDISTTQMCQISSVQPTVTDQCPCSLSQGPDPITGTCSPCGPGCDFCSGPGIDQCLRCNPTTSQGWNGTRCVLNCNSACSDCYGFTNNECPFCQSDYYNYQNGTCLSTCPYPFVKISQGSQQICQNPCTNPSDFYYEEDGSCQSSCTYPYEIINSPSPNKLCRIQISQEDQAQAQDVAKKAGAMDSATGNAIKAASLLSSGDSTSAGVGSMAKMLQYIKFMDITYPAKVEMMFRQNNNGGGALSLNFTGFLDEFPNTPLHRKYAFYNVSSSFFVNYWPSFITLSIIMIVILLLLALTSYTKASTKLHSISLIILSAIKWNTFLIIFTGSMGDIVFFTALELQTNKMNSFVSALSLSICLLINTLFIFVLIKILQSNWALRIAKKASQQDLETQTDLLKQFKALFDPYNNSSYSQQIYLFLFILRISSANAIIGYFYAYPLVQTVCLVLISFSMLLYLVIKRPLKLIVNFIQQVVLEICLLTANICVLILAIMDFKQISDLETREKVGNVIINLNLAMPIISVILLAAKFLLMGISFYLASKAKKKSENKFPEKIVQRISPKAHISLPVTTQPPTMDVKLKSRLRTQVGPANLKTTELLTIPIENPNHVTRIDHSNLQVESKFLFKYHI